MSEKHDGIYISVTILTKTWIFHGFDAIRELADYMDEHASDMNAPMACPGDLQPEAVDAAMPSVGPDTPPAGVITGGAPPL